MTCAAAQALIDLDPEHEQSDLTEHIENCPDCRKLMDEMTSLQNRVRAEAPYYQAPLGLKQRIESQVRAQASAPPGIPARKAMPVPYRWLAIAASVLLLASVIGNFALLRFRVSPEQVLAANIVSSHVRSLAGTHLLDVPSSDQHTVKPWFNGKLDFSPNVKDLAGDGFPLAGGRLEYFDGRPVAALVFERHKHIINLFTWPASDSDGDKQSTHNGYHMIRWAQGGMTYWAVSDLNEVELRQFVELYHK